MLAPPMNVKPAMWGGPATALWIVSSFVALLALESTWIGLEAVVVPAFLIPTLTQLWLRHRGHDMDPLSWRRRAAAGGHRRTFRCPGDERGTARNTKGQRDGPQPFPLT